MEYPFENGLDSESAGGLVAPGDFDGDNVDDCFLFCSFHGINNDDLYSWGHMGVRLRSSGWAQSTDIPYVNDAAWGELSWRGSGSSRRSDLLPDKGFR